MNTADPKTIQSSTIYPAGTSQQNPYLVSPSPNLAPSTATTTKISAFTPTTQTTTLPSSYNAKRLLDSYFNSSEESTPELKSLVALYIDNSFNVIDSLVFSHDIANSPDVRNTIDPLLMRNVQAKLKEEAMNHRNKVYGILQEVKDKLPPKADNRDRHFRRAMGVLSGPPINDATSKLFQEDRDDVSLILDNEITGLHSRRAQEKALAEAKRLELAAPKTIVQQSPSSVKIRMDNTGKYITHEINNSGPYQNVQVVLEKMSTSGEPTMITPIDLTKSYNDGPRRRSPTRSKVTMGQSQIEEYRGPGSALDDTPQDREVQRNYIPTRDQK